MQCMEQASCLDHDPRLDSKTQDASRANTWGCSSQGSENASEQTKAPEASILDRSNTESNQMSHLLRCDWPESP